jgi:hypothetical protein
MGCNIHHIDRDLTSPHLTFALEIENGLQRSEVANYDEAKQEIVMALEMLRDSPVREEMPLSYHLDLGAIEEIGSFSAEDPPLALTAGAVAQETTGWRDFLRSSCKWSTGIAPPSKPIKFRTCN